MSKRKKSQPLCILINYARAFHLLLLHLLTHSLYISKVSGTIMALQNAIEDATKFILNIKLNFNLFIQWFNRKWKFMNSRYFLCSLVFITISTKSQSNLTTTEPNDIQSWIEANLKMVKEILWKLCVGRGKLSLFP